MSIEDAVRLIQIHERARQGRLRAKFMRVIRQQEERERLAANRGAPTLDPDIAATRIQKVCWNQTFRKPAKYSRTFGPVSDQFSQDRKDFSQDRIVTINNQGCRLGFFLPLS